MDTSPSKRRKVSPQDEIAVDASNTELPPTNTPRPLTPGRASYMSPTKSSIARYNPDLLPRPKSAGGELSEETTDPSWTPRRLNAVPLRPTSPNERASRLSASPRRPARSSPVRSSTHVLGGTLSVPARRRSKTPGRYSEASALREGPGTKAISNVEQENAVNTQLFQELQAIAAGTAAADPEPQLSQKGALQRDGLQTAEDGEPELPPTPEHLGLKPIQPPPKGLLSSSPAARASKRRKAHDLSSPLKPKDTTNIVDPVEAHVEPEATQAQEDQQAVKDVDMFEESSVEEPSIEETRRRSALKNMASQLAALQSDVVSLEKAIPLALDSDGQTLPDLTNIISILTTSNPSRKPLPPQLRPLTLSAKLSLFLPFSKRAPLSLPKETTGESETLPSYHPITVDDPVSQLTAFHSLAVDTDEHIVSATLKDEALLRHQNVRLTSSSSLLAIKFGLTIDTSKESVNELTLNGISSWADQELGSWLRKQAPTGDVSSMGWACGRYWDVAQERARMWASCCKKFPGLVRPHLEKTRINLKVNVASDVASAAEGGPAHGGSDTPFSRTELHAHLGHTSLVLGHDKVSVQIHWNISFDWAGEVRSRLRIEPRFPSSWKAVDQRQSLSKVPSLFNRLVEERGISVAIAIVVKLVWSEMQA